MRGKRTFCKPERQPRSAIDALPRLFVYGLRLQLQIIQVLVRWGNIPRLPNMGSGHFRVHAELGMNTILPATLNIPSLSTGFLSGN